MNLSLWGGVGSFISNKAERDIAHRKIAEECLENEEFPEKEKEELVGLYVRDGWPKKFAKEMVSVAHKDNELFLKEMTYHELGIFPSKSVNPAKSGVFMFFSYILGGIIPLFPYFFYPINQAVVLSIILSLSSLFILGIVISKYATKRSWLKSGLELLLLAGMSGLVGYVVGQLISR